MWSELLNVLLGGGLVATVSGLVMLRSKARQAGAEAEKARAEAESVRFDNAEHATRILMENIVTPLKDEFNETKKELARNTREMARLRKAIDGANGCAYRATCPVLNRLREHPKDSGSREADGGTDECDGQPGGAECGSAGGA